MISTGQFLKAAEAGDLDTVKAFVTGEGRPCMNCADDSGFTALHLASQHNHSEITDFLVSYGADLEPENSYRRTPLISACVCNAYDVAKILLEAGAQVNAKDSAGCTALHYCCNVHDERFVELLLSHGADANAENDVGTTPLHIAAKALRPDSVSQLLQKGALVETKDNEGKSALDYILPFPADDPKREAIIDLFQKHAPHVILTAFCELPCGTPTI